MNLKDKLKNLLKNSGIEDSSIDGKIEEILAQQSEHQEEYVLEDLPPPESVRLDWEEIERIMQLQEELQKLKEAAGVLMLRYEDAKESLRKQIENNLKETKSEVNRLRADFGLPDDIDYQLNLPKKPGEMGSFIIDPGSVRKE